MFCFTLSHAQSTLYNRARPLDLAHDLMTEPGSYFGQDSLLLGLHIESELILMTDIADIKDRLFD